ncbi:MAG TPA: class I SAM-dependent methyltransferase [Gammaproteobacteria bacterium]|nr:class I SAM-dependent methyltransferase [Gammaproteobacteria bacterium]
MDSKRHWHEVYAQKAEDAVSWFQPRPDISLALIAAAGLDPLDPIVDVGGGASRLVDNLLAEGHRDVTVLDVAAAALEKSRARLDTAKDSVHWVVADITRWRPERRYRLWHDRAAFHFLTTSEDRLAYRRALEAGLMPGGTAIIASFAIDGPERCSGLPVQRYSPDTLAAELGPTFKLMERHQEEHTTPAGRVQHFQYSVFSYAPGVRQSPATPGP